MLGAMAGIAAPCGGIAVDKVPGRQFDEALRAVANAMSAMHGGQWTAHVDHDAGFILIRARPARARLS